MTSGSQLVLHRVNRSSTRTSACGPGWPGRDRSARIRGIGPTTAVICASGRVQFATSAGMPFAHPPSRPDGPDRRRSRTRARLPWRHQPCAPRPSPHAGGLSRTPCRPPSILRVRLASTLHSRSGHDRATWGSPKPGRRVARGRQMSPPVATRVWLVPADHPVDERDGPGTKWRPPRHRQSRACPRRAADHAELRPLELWGKPRSKAWTQACHQTAAVPVVAPHAEEGSVVSESTSPSDRAARTLSRPRTSASLPARRSTRRRQRPVVPRPATGVLVVFDRVGSHHRIHATRTPPSPTESCKRVPLGFCYSSMDVKYRVCSVG